MGQNPALSPSRRIIYDGRMYWCHHAMLKSYMDKDYEIWATALIDSGKVYTSLKYSHDGLGLDISELMRSKQSVGFGLVPKSVQYKAHGPRARSAPVNYASREVTLLVDEDDNFAGVTKSGDFRNSEIVLFPQEWDRHTISRIARFHKKQSNHKVHKRVQIRQELLQENGNDSLPAKTVLDSFHYGSSQWSCEAGQMQVVTGTERLLHIKLKDVIHTLVFELDESKQKALEESFSVEFHAGVWIDAHVFIDVHDGIVRCVSSDLEPSGFIFL